MIQQHLRHYSQRELKWHQQVLVWQQKGYVIDRHVSTESRLFHFRADTGWEGFIDLEGWLVCKMPQIAALSRTSRTPEQLEKLFIESNNPLTDLQEELVYKQLQSRGWVDRLLRQHAPYSCQTPQGRIWLYRLPNAFLAQTPDGQISTTIVPVEIDLQIGNSAISHALLKSLQPGDVVLINSPGNKISCNGRILGNFIRNEEGFMLDDDYEKLYDEDLFENDISDGQDQSLVPRDKVIVKITFILQKKRVSLAELESFYQGMILPCKPDVENNIIISANGLTIARGEMVWLEDRIGVEITDISYGDNVNARQ